MTTDSYKENNYIYNKDLMLNSYGILGKRRGSIKIDYKLRKTSKENTKKNIQNIFL